MKKRIKKIYYPEEIGLTFKPVLKEKREMVEREDGWHDYFRIDRGGNHFINGKIVTEEEYNERKEK
jgi:hypothetical protein